jgi:chitinase
MGGAAGSYAIASDADAQNVANYVWASYLGGGGHHPSPGGSKARRNRPRHRGGVVNRVCCICHPPAQPDERRRIQAVHYLGRAQCPFSDAYLGPQPATTALGSAAGAFNMLNVQFYNNFCGYQGDTSALISAWNQWSNWMATANPQMRLYLGLPASPSAAGSGYMSPDVVRGLLPQLKSSSNYGGVMLWSVNYDKQNLINGQPFMPISGVLFERGVLAEALREDKFCFGFCMMKDRLRNPCDVLENKLLTYVYRRSPRLFESR